MDTVNETERTPSSNLIKRFWILVAKLNIIPNQDTEVIKKYVSHHLTLNIYCI